MYTLIKRHLSHQDRKQYENGNSKNNNNKTFIIIIMKLIDLKTMIKSTINGFSSLVFSQQSLLHKKGEQDVFEMCEIELCDQKIIIKIALQFEMSKMFYFPFFFRSVCFFLLFCAVFFNFEKPVSHGGDSDYYYYMTHNSNVIYFNVIIIMNAVIFRFTQFFFYYSKLSIN